MVVVVILGVCAVLAVPALGMWRYMNADHLGIIDDPAVSGPATAACAKLAAAVDTVPPGPAARVIHEQDDAIGDLIATMEALGHERLQGDHPALGWVQDWRDLRTLRETYADELEAGGQATFTLPTVDGIPISSRMSDPGVTCPVAVRLATPPSS